MAEIKLEKTLTRELVIKLAPEYAENQRGQHHLACQTRSPSLPIKTTPMLTPLVQENENNVESGGQVSFGRALNIVIRTLVSVY